MKAQPMKANRNQRGGNVKIISAISEMSKRSINENGQLASIACMAAQPGGKYQLASISAHVSYNNETWQLMAFSIQYIYKLIIMKAINTINNVWQYNMWPAK